MRQFFIFTACIALISGSAQAMSEPAGEKEMVSTIMQWWPGSYNNDAQVSALEAAGQNIWRADGSGKGGHIEVTSHYRKVDLPRFGDNVLYVEETKHGDPNAMFRQRIYTVERDEAGLVRVTLWYFKDKEKYVGAYKQLDRLQELTPEDMSPLPDKCDLIARWDGEKIHMPMREGQCVFGPRGFNYQVLLGPDSFWFRDKIVNAETGETVESAGEFTYHKLDPITAEDAR